MAATTKMAGIFAKNLSFSFQIKLMSIKAWNFNSVYLRYIFLTYILSFSFWPPRGEYGRRENKKFR